MGSASSCTSSIDPSTSSSLDGSNTVKSGGLVNSNASLANESANLINEAIISEHSQEEKEMGDAKFPESFGNNRKMELESKSSKHGDRMDEKDGLAPNSFVIVPSLKPSKEKSNDCEIDEISTLYNPSKVYSVGSQNVPQDSDIDNDKLHDQVLRYTEDLDCGTNDRNEKKALDKVSSSRSESVVRKDIASSPTKSSITQLENSISTTALSGTVSKLGSTKINPSGQTLRKYLGYKVSSNVSTSEKPYSILKPQPPPKALVFQNPAVSKLQQSFNIEKFRAANSSKDNKPSKSTIETSVSKVSGKVLSSSANYVTDSVGSPLPSNLIQYFPTPRTEYPVVDHIEDGLYMSSDVPCSCSSGSIEPENTNRSNFIITLGSSQSTASNKSTDSTASDSKGEFFDAVDKNMMESILQDNIPSEQY